MHGKDTFSEFREFINTMESRVQELGKVHGVEHLAGPQGFAVKCLTIKIKKSLSKTLRKDYVFLNQWLVIWSNEWKKMVLLSW